MTSEAAYPYDPKLNIQVLHGLNRLRAVADRRLAAELYKLYWYAEENERSSESLAARNREAASRQAEDHEHLQSMANKALSGQYGFKSKELTREITSGGQRMDIRTLKHLRRELRKVPGRTSA